MGKSLIITEKPSVAQEFAKVLKVSGRQDGYIENQEYVITWCVGHLVGLVYPEDYDIKYKKWKLEDLPFLPKEYKYDVISNVRKQYTIVNGMLHREDIDRVYWAGDAGKEGQTIEENIRNFGGVREGMEELRVWIDSQTEEEILRGIHEAKPMSAYANLGNSGIMRTIEDYAMGINFSRVMSIKYGNLLNKAAGTKSYTAIAVGRVMTCVLGMVVIREREIRNFKETPFYKVIAKFTDDEIEGEWKSVDGSSYFESPLLYKENGFKEEKDAQELIDKLKDSKAVVDSIDKSVSRKKAPLLFNLAELQAECSKKFKISPDETLQIAQDLYEKKLTTYPRTDARVLSSAVAKEIYKNLNKLKGFDVTSSFTNKILENKSYANIANTQYTDDSKVTDHYAIIPTGQLSELNTLNSLQRSVFELIVRRFLSIFYPPAEYETVKLCVNISGERFFTSAKVLKKEGYLEVATPPKKKTFEESNNRILGGQKLESEADSENEEITFNPKILIDLADKVAKGDEIDVNGFGIKFGKTSPPKRYTSGSMVLAMENAGQLIEDEELREQIKGSGIGTSATRAEIIKKLVRIEYLNLNKKTQILTPNNLGEMVYEVVNMTVPSMLNPKMTASWEKGLEGITNGTVDFWEYREKLENFIRRETQKMISVDIKEPLAERISDYAGKNATGAGARRKIGAVCPWCKGQIVTTPFGYGCANYKNDKSGCNFSIGEIAGVSLEEEQAVKLLKEGRTDTIRGFKSKNGKKFDAALVLAEEEGKQPQIQFDFNNVEPEYIEDVMCPDCGGKIRKTVFGYGCDKYSADDEKSCKFSIGQIAGKSLSVSNLKQLLNAKKTDTIRGFKSKNGKKFDACLVLVKNSEGRSVVQFDFDNVQDDIIPDVECPICGGKIKRTSFGYGCMNYKGDEEGSCKFSVGQIAGKSIPVSNLKQLLTTRKTETIRGFKSKTGKKFDACLVLKEDENGISIQFDFENVEAKKVSDVKCPICGGDIVVTPFGYGCANYDKENEESCKFSIGKMAEKSLTEAQVKQLLTKGCTETIRGFKSKTGKKFDAKIALMKNEDNKVTGLKFDFNDLEPVTVKDVKCPLCKGKIVVTPFGYGCENYKKDDPKSCKFSIGKIAGVKLKEKDVKLLLLEKKTPVISGFIAKTGMMFDAALKLTEDGKVEFDFPQRPEPVETEVICPKCQKKMLRTQWQLECECGFKLWHTIAKVQLSDEIISELLTTGKTKDKVTGFISKAGNTFDTCLKYEDGDIKFDFENKGENPSDKADDNSLDFSSISDEEMQYIQNFQESENSIDTANEDLLALIHEE